jgi:hypothetical protein
VDAEGRSFGLIVLADLDVPCRDHAGIGARISVVAQFERAAVIGGLQCVEIELRVLGRALGDEPFFRRLLLALVVALELAQVGFRLLDFETQTVAVQTREQRPRP